MNTFNERGFCIIYSRFRFHNTNVMLQLCSKSIYISSGTSVCIRNKPINQKWETHLPTRVFGIVWEGWRRGTAADQSLSLCSLRQRSWWRKRQIWVMSWRQRKRHREEEGGKKWLEWHVRACYDCRLGRAGLIMDGLRSAAGMTAARLPSAAPH